MPPAAPAPPAPPAVPAPAPQRLPIGITENNPHLIAPGAAPEGFGPWRDRLLALHPRYVRLFVDWAKLQSDPAQPADLRAPGDGCSRGAAPCAPYAGVADQLAAIAAAQRAQGGMELMVVVYGVPDWAARRAGGCERSGSAARARPMNDAGLAAYGRLLTQLRDAAVAAGTQVAYWAPWNESNHPAFVSPQRRACSAAAPSRGPRLYTRLVRAARAALGPDAKLVLGELAGFEHPTALGSGVGEFVRALPDDVACGAAVWSQHNYVRPDSTQHDAVGELERALDARPCTKGATIWVTETGVGGTRSGAARDTSDATLKEQCRAMDRALRRWAADPRVAGVFQYTFREDTVYPVGLADAALTRTYPTYDLLLAWAQTPPGAPPPALPAACADQRPLRRPAARR